MKVKEIIRKLEADGWEQVRMRGDHRIFKKQGYSNNVCVSGALNDDLKPGTQRSILRGAGLS